MPADRVCQSKKQFVYETLKEEIVRGKIAPEARLVIHDVAARFDVSAIPVREALLRLEGDGFITFAPYVGARVTAIHERFLHEVFSLLESLELISCRAACRNMNRDDIHALKELLEVMDGKTDSPQAWAEDNARMHRLICERGGTRLAAVLMDAVLTHWDRLRRVYLKGVFEGRVKTAQMDHWKLYRALKAGDPDRAEDVIRSHNRTALAAYRKHMKTRKNRKA